MNLFVMTLVVTSVMGSVLAVADESTPGTNVKYKSAKDINFEQLVIEGQLKRPELSVVTGDDDQGEGLLRLREDFVDHLTADVAEEIQ